MKTKLLIIVFFTIFVNSLYSNVAITNGLTHIYSGSSGDVISGEVILVNGSTEEQYITFELNDAIFSCTTNRIFTKEYTHPQSSINWFESNITDKVLAPKERYVYRFTIKIPKDKTLRGSYWSALMVHLENPIREDSINGNIGLDSKITYAVGLLTHVNTFDELNINFKDITISENENSNKKQLEVKLFNKSLFIEGVRLSLEIYDKNGTKIYEAVTDRNMTFPGFCRDYKIDISELISGEYDCVLIADSREEFVGTNISLTIK